MDIKFKRLLTQVKKITGKPLDTEEVRLICTAAQEDLQESIDIIDIAKHLAPSFIDPFTYSDRVAKKSLFLAREIVKQATE